ncbi:MAG: hypothetical protein QOH08_1075 [Chloroflexota bacterium]|jgi:hypothetical protein|nr:hypothetical protein [Chloroflexota bacterium]
MRIRVPGAGSAGRFRNPAIATVVFVLAFFGTQWWDFTVPAVGRAQYQAVFLTNGQTYFGRYYDRIGAYAKIEDVYYLQQAASADPNGTPETKIIRRGGELHAPAARMYVPRSAVLFVEDLTDASPIAQFMRQDHP